MAVALVAVPYTIAITVTTPTAPGSKDNPNPEVDAKSEVVLVAEPVEFTVGKIFRSPYTMWVPIGMGIEGRGAVGPRTVLMWRGTTTVTSTSSG